MPRFRSTPSAVHDSPEWARASALARLFHRTVRPSAGELALARSSPTEPPWQQWQRKAAELGAFLSQSEATDVVEACTSAGLWAVRDGQLVIPAYPPSFEAERQRRSLGPRGGLSPAEKMARWRARQREREAVENGHENGNGGHSGDGSEGAPPLPSSGPLKRPQREGEGRPTAATTPTPPTAPPAAPPEAPPEGQRTPAELAELDDATRGALAVERLAKGVPPTLLERRAGRDDLVALGRAVVTLGLSELELRGVAAWLRTEPDAARAALQWSKTIRGGAPITVGLLAATSRRGGKLGVGLRALAEIGVPWAKARAPATFAPPVKTTATPATTEATG